MKSLFQIPAVSFTNVAELVPYTLLGILCAVIGIFYVKFFNKLRESFDSSKVVGNILKPALGGFLLGVLALYLPEVLGGGYDYIQMAFNGYIPFYLMLLLIFGKIFATTLTIGSGGSGGIFAPSLYIGAMLGGASWCIFKVILPHSWLPPESAFMVVAMGGFFAGIARVPISSLVLVSEMTKGYELLVPMMLVSSLAFLLNRKPYTLYDEQAASFFDSPAHKGEFEVDILDNIKVRDAAIEKNILTIPRRMTLDKIIQLASHTKQDTFPVVDKKNKDAFVGVITFENIRENVMNKENVDGALADDIAVQDYPFVTESEDLHSAMNKFLINDDDSLPVMDKEGGKLLGLLTRTNFINIYNQKFLVLKKPSK